MDHDDSDWKTAAKAVPELRFLKLLVTGLTLVMGLGIIAIVVLLWLRLGAPVLPDLPEAIALPDGAAARAITFTDASILVVTDRDEALIYDRAGGLRGRIDLAPR